jgi:putative SOS response-associated peptidase YedK
MNFDNKHSKVISEFFGCDFNAPSNNNLSPGQSVATLIRRDSNNDSKSRSIDEPIFKQLDATWGIQPSWSKRLLINAQSETVLSKGTFKEAIKTHRCLIPCSGWYEWRTEQGKKQKYLFSHVNDEPMLMAGIWYVKQSNMQGKNQSTNEELNSEPKQQLVTLTTAPNDKCAEYHQRMPVIVLPRYRDFWFHSAAEQLPPLFEAIDQDYIKVTAA